MEKIRNTVHPMMQSTAIATGQKGITGVPRRGAATDQVILGEGASQAVAASGSNVYTANNDTDGAQVWQHLLRQCQEALRKDCQGINLRFQEQGDYGFPSMSTDGVQIIISKGFLERLAASQEAYTEGCAYIKDVWQQLQSLHQQLTQPDRTTGVNGLINADGQLSLTLASQQVGQPEHSQRSEFNEAIMSGNLVRYYKEKGGRNITEIKTANGSVRIIITKRLGYRPGRDLARLAQATKVGNVRTMAAGVQAAIRRAKSDRYLDEDEVRQAVVQMQGVVQRAKAKISQLHREEIMEQRAHQAAKQGEQKEAIELARQLKRQRTVRIAKEYAQIHQTFQTLQDLRDAKWASTGPSLSMEYEVTSDVSAAPSAATTVDQMI